MAHRRTAAGACVRNSTLDALPSVGGAARQQACSQTECVLAWQRAHEHPSL